MGCFTHESAARGMAVCLGLLVGAVAVPSGQPGKAVAAPAPFPRRDSPSTELIAALDKSAGWARGLMRAAVDVDLREGRQAIGMAGRLAFERSGRYRLVLRVLGQAYVDIGSNEREAWWRCGKGRVLRFIHPRKGDVDAKTAWNLPIHPDWLPAMLGLVEYRRARDCKVMRRKDRLELVEKVVAPGGKALRKVTVVEQSGKQARVVGARLEDAGGKVILSCSIVAFVRDRNTGLDVPSRVKLLWPDKRLEIVLRLSGVECFQTAGGRQARRLFTPPPEN